MQLTDRQNINEKTPGKILLPLRSYGKKLLDIILPPRCISCGEFTKEVGSLCGECWGKINFLGKPCCSICSNPFEYNLGPDALCISCAADKPQYDRAVSVFCYDERSRQLITRFKYSDKTHATNSYAKWLARTGKALIKEADYIIPVPLHRIRLLARRYNQSALLANRIGKNEHKTVLVNLLLRKKHNKPQAALTRKERLVNVKGIFMINNKYKNMIVGKNILLVDDVMTTGATIYECAKVLKKAGAAKVFVVTLARTVER